MPSFAYMKILESKSERYDHGLQILSRGRIAEVYQKIADAVAGRGVKILDIGCGTGNLSILCAEKGSLVTGIDINSGMLEVAQEKVRKAGLSNQVKLLELGVAEIEQKIPRESIDSCVSCLTFSELSENEIKYTLSMVFSVLRPGGVLMIADEAFPRSAFRGFLHSLVNIPIKFLSYVLTQTTTRPIRDLSEDLKYTGFKDIKIKRIWNDTFMIISGTKEVGP